MSQHHALEGPAQNKAQAAAAPPAMLKKCKVTEKLLGSIRDHQVAGQGARWKSAEFPVCNSIGFPYYAQNRIDAPELADIASLDRVAYSQKVGVFRSLWQKPRCEERVRDRDDRSATSANPAKPSSSQPGQPAEPSEAGAAMAASSFFFFVPGALSSRKILSQRFAGGFREGWRTWQRRADCLVPSKESQERPRVSVRRAQLATRLGITRRSPSRWMHSSRAWLQTDACPKWPKLNGSIAHQSCLPPASVGIRCLAPDYHQPWSLLDKAGAESLAGAAL